MNKETITLQDRLEALVKMVESHKIETRHSIYDLSQATKRSVEQTDSYIDNILNQTQSLLFSNLSTIKEDFLSMKNDVNEIFQTQSNFESNVTELIENNKRASVADNIALREDLRYIKETQSQLSLIHI